MTYRDDLDALSERATALEQHAVAARKDAEEARRLFEEAQARRRLPVLDNLHIAAPCSEDWAKMTGDARTRFCASCEKNVYNLSEMTRAEAEALLIEKEGKLCVRYYQRTDGTILTADCPVGVKRRRRRRRVVAAAFGAVSALAAAASMLHRGPTMMMGAVAQATPVGPHDPELVEQSVAVMGEAPAFMGQVAVPAPSVAKPAKKPTPHPRMGTIAVPRDGR
jgi:hypothetical protein